MTSEASESPYADAAADYLARGWSPIPLPFGHKEPPPPGFTGYAGAHVAADDLTLWGTGRRNVALRLPDAVLALDIDNYGGKAGALTLSEAVARLGALPHTWRSTARADDPLSGIRYFRVPAGRQWADRLGDCVEVIHHGHRYAVVAPSVHPEGMEYGWFDLDGLPTSDLPTVAELPELPASWVAELDRGDVADRPAKVQLKESEAGRWLQELPEGDPCQAVLAVLDEGSRRLSKAASRHDTARALVLRIVRLGEQGHVGATVALDTLEALWLEALTDRAPGWCEYERMVSGAVGIALGAPTPAEQKGCCRPLPEPGEVDVSDQAEALRWLRDEVGRGQLAGLFRRGGRIVHTPRIGESGYIEPKSAYDDEGPAQVRVVGGLELSARVDYAYRVIKQEVVKGRYFDKSVLFPQGPADRVLSAPDLLPNVKELRSVTHTPTVLADGSVMDEPGFNERAGLLYLPAPGLVVPRVATNPTREDADRAGRLLLEMLDGFPFVTPHDKANYLGALLTPLLRELVPPPYKLVAIGAPQRGSGKSLLALLLRTIHGGVFRAEFPAQEEEVRKVITATLYGTTGVVVQFDNVTGTLKSGTLDGVLTTARDQDRLFGKNSEVLDLRNDRLWVVTGNNLRIGGDLVRRTLWVTINANVERPEERTDFAIADLAGWAETRRGELLWALLTLVRAWVVAGQPVGDLPTSDQFGRWVQVLRGILGVADLGDGVVGHVDSVRTEADPEEAEWAGFLAAVWRWRGSEPWTAKELLLGVAYDETEGGVREEELPGAVADKRGVAGARTLGNWLDNRRDRWAGGRVVRSQGTDRTGVRLWRVE